MMIDFLSVFFGVIVGFILSTFFSYLRARNGGIEAAAKWHDEEAAFLDAQFSQNTAGKHRKYAEQIRALKAWAGRSLL